MDGGQQRPSAPVPTAWGGSRRVAAAPRRRGAAAAVQRGRRRGPRLPELEAAIFAEVNAVRCKKGCVARGLARPSGGGSCAFARDARERRFRHESANGTSFSERIRRFYPSRGFRSWTVGENLIYQTDEVQAAEAVAAWLGSPPHRRNMFSTAWREIGIGVARSPAAPGDFGGDAVAVGHGRLRRPAAARRARADSRVPGASAKEIAGSRRIAFRRRYQSELTTRRQAAGVIPKGVMQGTPE